MSPNTAAKLLIGKIILHAEIFFVFLDTLLDKVTPATDQIFEIFRPDEFGGLVREITMFAFVHRYF